MRILDIIELSETDIPADKNTPVGTRVKISNEFLRKSKAKFLNNFWKNKIAIIISNEIRTMDGFYLVAPDGSRHFWHKDWVILA